MIVAKEYESLLIDKTFLSKLPRIFNFGAIVVDISELKEQYLNSLNEILSLFQAAFLSKISKLIDLTEEAHNQLIESIKIEPKSLEEYIEIKKYLTSIDFKTKRNRMIENIDALKLCLDSIEKFVIEIDANLLQISLEAFTWPSKIKTFRKEKKMKLNEMKPKFLKVIEERKANLFEKFQNLQKESRKFEDYYDLNQTFLICQISKDLVAGFKELISSAKKLNEQESFLQFTISELQEFELFYSEFEKFAMLWDFAEKWKFVTIFH